MLKKIHPAWIVLICVILIQGGMIGIMVNCTSVLFAAIIKDMGFKASELSLHYTIRQIACALSIGAVAKLFFSKNSRIVMFIMGLLSASAYFIMSVSTQVWHWYITAVMVGIGMNCFTVVLPTALSNWFHSHKGLVVGLSMSASGVGGALYSPISSGLISAFGWRTTAVITGVIGLVMVALGSLFFHITPEKLGLKPFGEKAETAAAAQSEDKFSKPVPLFALICAMFALLSVNSYTQLNNQIPTFAQSIGYSLTVGALFTSGSMIGNIVGKLLSGVLNDRFGVYRAVQFSLLMTFTSMLLFLFGSQYQIVMQVASVCYGLVYALGTTIPSLLFLDLYGKEKSRPKVQLSQTLSYFFMAFTSFLFPYIFDVTGSFTSVFVAGAALCVIAFIIMEWLRIFSKNRG